MADYEMEPERQEEELTELEGFDMDTAKLENLVEALKKLEMEKRALLDSIRALRTRLAEEKADQGDVYYYLHKKLDDNYDVISALERQLVVETADREKTETEYNRRIDELRLRRDEELGPLNERLVAVDEQVNSLHEAAENKRESDAKKRRLENEIKVIQSKLGDDLDLERRTKLQEKQRIRRQIETEVKQLSLELSSKKEVELARKTVRAADNNDKLHAALHAKAKHAERIMVTNQGLAFENSSLRNDVDLAKESEVVLLKRVRLYHDLVVGLKAQLEEETSTLDVIDEKRELADLEETLAESGGGSSVGESIGLDTASLVSDCTPSSQVVWAGGACEGLVYESVDELHVAVESLQRMHAELQEEAMDLTARVEEMGAVNARHQKATTDPLTDYLLESATAWMSRLKLKPAAEKGEADTGSFVPTDPVGSEWKSTSNNRSKRFMSHRVVKAGTLEKAGRYFGGLRTIHGLAYESQLELGQQELSAVTHLGSEAGALAEATGTPLCRRQLFYHLVDAFREYQARARQADSEMAGGKKSVHGAGSAAEGEGDENELPPEFDAPAEKMSSTGRGGIDEGFYGGASASDISSVSVRTLRDFGAPELRSVSTQTVAKHFPDKLTSVRPARRIVVDSTTFLTSSSIFSASTARSAGYGAFSVDNQFDRRYF